MFDKLAEDIEKRYWQKLAALEKEAASNLRSDLVLGRLSDAAKESLMSTPRYSKNSPGQILADIKSMLRGKGNDVGALTSELTRRGIPYKVRGKGLSPKDIELDLSKGHDILNTPYLPSNYSESFIDNNVNRRFGKAVNNANRAGYYNIKPVEEYSYPSVVRPLPGEARKKREAIKVNIPAKRVAGEDALQFDNHNAGTILHETNELNQAIHDSQYYDKVIKNMEQNPLRTAGEYPGVMVPRGRDRNGDDVLPLSLFGTNSESPYDTTGYNNHISATILMNELMDQNAAHAGIKPKPNTLDDIFSYRKAGPRNPVNRMTGIDLDSRRQPFVPRNIAKNKKEYLKRIRAVRKAEDALHSEYLRKQKLLGESDYNEPFYPLEDLVDDQINAAVKKELPNTELFKAFPQNIKFKDISDFDQYLQKNPEAKQYIDNNHKFISKLRSELPDDVGEWLRNLPMDKPFASNEDAHRFTNAQTLLRSVNNIFEEDYRNLVDAYKDRDIYGNFRYHLGNRRDKYKENITGNPQQNMDFLVNYLRSRGIPVE